jgi:hypothetical protein
VKDEPSGLNSFNPLYSSGLWEAVIIHPAFAVRVAKATDGVGAIPATYADPPLPIIPDITRCARRGLVVRVSIPITISEDRDANADPILKAVSISV